MHSLKQIFFLSVLTIVFNKSNAQIVPSKDPFADKPAAFSAMPDSLSIPVSFLDSLFRIPAGTEVTIPLPESRALPGILVSSVIRPVSGILTSQVKLSGYSRMVLTVSKSTGPDGKVIYTGRAFSPDYSDSFTIVITNEYYSLKKINSTKLLNE